MADRCHGDTISLAGRLDDFASSHTWFVLRYLLGLDSVTNYDGSWTEWGNLVGAPVERGAAASAARG